MKLQPKDIISYAYFVKEVQYLSPFEKKETFYFQANGNSVAVKGFKSNTDAQRKNVQILEYKSDSDFALRLRLKQKDEELYLVMGSTKMLPEQVASLVTANH